MDPLTIRQMLLTLIPYKSIIQIHNADLLNLLFAIGLFLKPFAKTMHNGDLNNEQLNNRNIQIMNLCLSGIQMSGILMVIRYSDHHSNTVPVFKWWSEYPTKFSPVFK